MGLFKKIVDKIDSAGAHVLEGSEERLNKATAEELKKAAKDREEKDK